MNKDDLPMRIYLASEVAGFKFTRAPMGPFSNMAPGAFDVNGIHFRTSEHYYQAMKFPDRPDWQQKVIDAPSAKDSKKVAWACGKPRKDWDELEVLGNVMRHAVRLKYAFNRDLMNAQYALAAGRMIVEISDRDDLWGAIPQAGGKLVGRNLLGRIHLELRKEIDNDPDIYSDEVPAPTFSRAILLGEEVGIVASPHRTVQTTFDL